MGAQMAAPIRENEHGPVWCSPCAVGIHQNCGITTPVVLGRRCYCAKRRHGRVRPERHRRRSDLPVDA